MNLVQPSTPMVIGGRALARSFEDGNNENEGDAITERGARTEV